MARNLLIVLSLILYFAVQKIEAGSLNCDNKNADECKKEFVAQLDLRFQEFHLKAIKREIVDVVGVFNAVIAELPANDSKAKMLKTSINELKADADKMEAYRNDYEKTRTIIRNMEMNLQPHVMLVSLDKKTLNEFEKLLEKHNYTKIMEKFDFNEFIEAFTKMWIELHGELRASDLKEYPAYNEINEKMKIIVTEKVQAKKEKLIREVMKNVREFCKIPFLEEVIFYGRESKKQ